MHGVSESRVILLMPYDHLNDSALFNEKTSLFSLLRSTFAKNQACESQICGSVSKLNSLHWSKYPCADTIL